MYADSELLFQTYYQEAHHGWVYQSTIQIRAVGEVFVVLRCDTEETQLLDEFHSLDQAIDYAFKFA